VPSVLPEMTRDDRAIAERVRPLSTATPAPPSRDYR
jgi:hypothetical protein